MRPPGCWTCAFAMIALKLLLFPAYHSTDFRVHRDWMGMISTSSWMEWYRDDRSAWTLDYPPFFAWWEWIRSMPARWIDPDMLRLDSIGCDSDASIRYQRATVVLSELAWLATGAWYYAKVTEGRPSGGMQDARGSKRTRKGWMEASIAMGTIGCAGIVIVDHIHFQFNGMLLGMLVWSLGLAQAGHAVLSSIVFAVLLHFKHLFAFGAPAYLVYMFRSYCRGNSAHLRFLALAASVCMVTLASMGPFLWTGGWKPMMERLFPFGRGLLHAYWAPNAWALYAALDKVLLGMGRVLGRIPETRQGHLSGGLVAVQDFAVLPNITPVVSGIMVLLSLVPCLVALWKRPTKARFSRSVAYCFLCGFMFGYHVHEKAVLHFLVPYALDAVTSPRTYEQFSILARASYYGLMPLLFTLAEGPIKVLLVEVLHGSHMYLLGRCHQGSLVEGRRRWILAIVSSILWIVQAYVGGFHRLLFGDRLPFLPLILQSVTSSLVITLVWVQEWMHWILDSFGSDGSDERSFVVEKKLG